MDGTLVASDGVWDQALAELAADHGGRLPAEFFAEIVGLPTAEAVALVHRTLGVPEGHLDRDLMWVHDRVHERLEKAPPAWFRGARELVLSVRASGLLTGLVTSSGRTTVEVALSATDRASFDVIVCGDDVRALKPSPEPYLRAAAALGLQPAECAVVEDSRSGVISALAAGCRLVVVASVAPVTPAGDVRYPVVGAIAEVDVDLLRSLQHRAVRG